MRFDLVEHTRKLLVEWKEGDADSKVFYDACKELSARTFLSRNKPVPYYKIHSSDSKIELEADYYIGADWVLPGKKFVYVAPKINTKLIERFKVELDKEDDTSGQDNPPPCDDVKELNYLKMYMEAVSRPEVLKHSSDLLFIDWNAPEIQINQKEDLLTPFLVVQYLNLLQQIVRKGLKKSYYTVTNNLQSRVKGKILVGQNIKTNIVKNRLTNTVCQYQEFGVNSTENRFLKNVLTFVSTYIANNEGLFKGNEVSLLHIIGFCNPAFENVSGECAEHELKNIKPNVFYKEYKEAIRIGKLLLKRFAYNISNTLSSQPVSTPPFWIDMPRLFELYVYKKLLDSYSPSEVKYHFKARGNELDFLVKIDDRTIVVDAKYKLHYQNGHIHQDIRQVAGYSRLSRVYKVLGLDPNDKQLIDCLIIHPSMMESDRELKIDKCRLIEAYNRVFKLGLTLP